MFQNNEALLTSLLNRNARLEFVLAEYLEAYAAALKTAKAAKVEAAMNRVSCGTFEKLRFLPICKPLIPCVRE